MEFEARMIDETDFHGIRRLLQQVNYVGFMHNLLTSLELGSPVPS